MPREDKLDENEVLAAREFGQQRKVAPRRDPTPRERAEARQRAQEAAKLPEVAPPPPAAAKADSRAGSAPAMVLPAEVVEVASAVCCRCGQELGGNVRGVYQDGAWYCPVDFMSVRSRDAHPAARPVSCPTCHHVAVDFSGRNVCPVCRSRAAQPLRRAS